MSERELKREAKRGFRTVMREMNRSLRFDTPDELDVLRGNFEIARKRSLMGLVGGGAACGLGWRYTMGKHLTPLVAAWGAIAGMTVGMFSVRQKLFLDLLSIPEDRSPFAHRARLILEKEMPQSVLLSEIKRRRRELFPLAEDSTDGLIWTEPPPPSFETFVTIEDVEAKGQRRRGRRDHQRPGYDDVYDAERDAYATRSTEDEARTKKARSSWDEQRHRASRGF